MLQKAIIANDSISHHCPMTRPRITRITERHAKRFVIRIQSPRLALMAASTDNTSSYDVSIHKRAETSRVRIANNQKTAQTTFRMLEFIDETILSLHFCNAGYLLPFQASAAAAISWGL